MLARRLDSLAGGQPRDIDSGRSMTRETCRLEAEGSCRLRRKQGQRCRCESQLKPKRTWHCSGPRIAVVSIKPPGRQVPEVERTEGRQSVYRILNVQTISDALKKTCAAYLHILTARAANHTMAGPKTLVKEAVLGHLGTGGPLVVGLAGFLTAAPPSRSSGHEEERGSSSAAAFSSLPSDYTRQLSTPVYAHTLAGAIASNKQHKAAKDTEQPSWFPFLALWS